MTWQSDFKTKKAFKEAATGKHISDVAFQPGLFYERLTGNIAVEGPSHYHTWYASVQLDEHGNILRVK